MWQKAAVFLVCLLYGASAYGAEKSYPLINGAQVFVLDEKYKSDPGKFFREAKAKGINAVFFRAFHNEGDRAHFGLDLPCSSGVYFKTDQTCVAGDILSRITEAARQNHVKVFAWMATRSLTYLKTPENLSQSFSPEGGIIPGYGANIFKPEVRSSLIRLFKDLAAYDIDGVLFQDDFILKYTEGAGRQARELFKAETGMEARTEVFFEGVKSWKGKKTFGGLKDEFYVWARWKSRHLTQLFSEIKEAVKSVNPQIVFAANIYYETPIYPLQGLAWYSQNVEALKEAGADYFAVMGYSEQISAEQRLGAQETSAFIGRVAREAARYAGEPSRVIMKLQSRSFLGKGRLSKSGFADVCREITKTSGLSVAVVPVFSSEDIYSCFLKINPEK